MKTAEQWLSEMRSECSHGEPSTPMLERIKQIQADAIDGCMIAPELVEENDSLRAQVAIQKHILLRRKPRKGPVEPPYTKDQLK